MNPSKDKVSGNLDQLAGKAKAAMGKALNSEDLTASALLQQVRGKGEEALGEAKTLVQTGLHKVGDAVERLGGAVERLGNKIEHLADK